MRMAVASCTVRAAIADETVVADLGVTKGSAILIVEMLYRDDTQRNVEFSIARHPATCSPSPTTHRTTSRDAWTIS